MPSDGFTDSGDQPRWLLLHHDDLGPQEGVLSTVSGGAFSLILSTESWVRNRERERVNYPSRSPELVFISIPG
jgi:hypothetical protein